MSSFAELKEEVNAELKKSNAELREEVNAIAADFKEKLSANEQQMAEFKNEPFAKYSIQEKRPDTTSELVVKNGAPQTSTLTWLSLPEEILINEVKNDPHAGPKEPKLETALETEFQAPATPHLPLHAKGATTPTGKLYLDQPTLAQSEAIYTPPTIPGVNENILTTDVTAREQF